MASISLNSLPRCPACGAAGRQVDGATIKSMLRAPLTAVPAEDYWFCRTASCPVVYFGGNGAHTLNEADLNEKVFQKHSDQPDTPICYCFGFSVGDVQNPERANHVLGVIEAGIRAGQCACDSRNPQGDCCLGNVRAVAKRNSVRAE